MGVDKLVKQLEGVRPLIKNIYGVPRGGLVVAVMLSHKLDIPLIMIESHIGPQTLVIDDICDSGATLNALVKKKKCFATATLSVNTETPRDPVYFAFKESLWIIYPWETEATSKYDNKTKN